MLLKKYQKPLMEALDMHDLDNVRMLSSFTESEQKRATIILADKLYGMIVDKLEDIDFKEIEQSQGDVSKFKYYERTRECIAVLKAIADQSGSGQEEVKDIETALDNLYANRMIFVKAFKTNVSVIKYLYNTVYMAIIADIGFMTTVCVEFVKNPDHTMGMEISNLMKYKSRFYLIHKNLKSFNESVSKGDLDKVAGPLLKIRTKNIVGIPMISLLLLIPGSSIVLLGMACGILISSFIPIMRELAYIFFSLRVSIANYCTLQAKLLEANSLKVKQRTTGDKKENKEISRKQESIANFFNKVANFFAIKYVPVENNLEKELPKARYTKLDPKELELPDSTPPASDEPGEDNTPAGEPISLF